VRRHLLLIEEQVGNKLLFPMLRIKARPVNQQRLLQWQRQNRRQQQQQQPHRHHPQLQERLKLQLQERLKLQQMPRTRPLKTRQMPSRPRPRLATAAGTSLA